MSREAAFWQIVKTHLSPFGSLERIENRINIGTPDVAFALTHPPTKQTVAGWMELKSMPAWPVRPATPFNIPHLTIEQVEWLENWRGNAFMLLRVGNTVMAHKGYAVRAIYERRYPALEVMRSAAVLKRGAFPTGDLLRWLVKSTET